MEKRSSGGWFRNLFRPKPPLSKQPPSTSMAKSMAKRAAAANPYHAVSIIPGEHACAAAYRFAGHRFLSRHAPKIPLSTCDAFHCTCRFKHYKDRRAGPRRRADIGLMSGHYPGPERRRREGRRSTDN